MGREPRVTVVIDLGFGDAGKGTTVDFLVRDAVAGGSVTPTVVRFNGGAQAGHTVITDDGRSHTFSQLGAGTFAGAATHLAEPVVVHPTALLVEARVLEGKGVPSPLSRLTIAEGARLITPFHQAANLLREAARGAEAHGTCGVGFGEAVADALDAKDDALFMGDLRDPDRSRIKLRRSQERVRASLGDAMHVAHAAHREVLEDGGALAERWLEAVRPVARCVTEASVLGRYLRGGPVVFEGAQGVLLDEVHGFHPHTTWSDCTSRGAQALIEAHGGPTDARVLGVTRSYHTRHGAGPFPSEDPSLRNERPEPHNDDRGAQGAFRVGALDLLLLRYALRACPIDGLVVTHLDRPPAPWVVAYQHPSSELFVHDATGRVVDLRGGDLLFQERLGATLREVVASRVPPPDAHDWMAALEGELARAVVLTSHGPTAANKAWRVSG